MRMINHWIAGRETGNRPGGVGLHVGQVHNPATGEVSAEVDYATPAEVDAAVAAAQEAFAGWRSTSLARRTKVLFAFRNLIDSHQEELARIITAEHGKTLEDARGEVARGLDVIEFACGIPHVLEGGFSANVSTSIDTYSIRQPLGVVAGITPFNFPVMVPMWMFPIAVACGNCFVLKPSEKDPSASIMVARLWEEAGLPPGVFNVVHGDKVAVDAILAHPGIAAVSFVGSTPVARYIYVTAASAGKRVQALGGAKNHAVVLPDADTGFAADAIASAAYGSAGERCMAISAVVAVGAAGDPLVEALAVRARELRTGPGDDERSGMGPLITEAHRDRVAGYLVTGVAEGAELVVDGREGPIDGSREGYYLRPSLFDGVTPEMAIYRDEIFGPVLCVLRVPTFEDAVELVNASPYANGAAIFTNDGLAARSFEEKVDAGMVGINVPIPTPVAYYSFGGAKQSLFGDTHVHGEHGVHFYTKTKAVTARWPKPADGSDMRLAFPSTGQP